MKVKPMYILLVLVIGIYIGALLRSQAEKMRDLPPDPKIIKYLESVK